MENSPILWYFLINFGIAYLVANDSTATYFSYFKQLGIWLTLCLAGLPIVIYLLLTKK